MIEKRAKTSEKATRYAISAYGMQAAIGRGMNATKPTSYDGASWNSPHWSPVVFRLAWTAWVKGQGAARRLDGISRAAMLAEIRSLGAR